MYFLVLIHSDHLESLKIMFYLVQLEKHWYCSIYKHSLESFWFGFWRYCVYVSLLFGFGICFSQCYFKRK